MSSASEATILFTDGTTAVLKYSGEVNCGDFKYFYCFFNERLEILSSKVVKKIRITAESNKDFEISNGTYFSEAIRCLRE